LSKPQVTQSTKEDFVNQWRKNMDDLPIGTIRIKHKLIPQIPFIIVNESDFNPEIMTLYEEPVPKEEDKAPALAASSASTKDEDTTTKKPGAK
jgi:hypothetical protein